MSEVWGEGDCSEVQCIMGNGHTGPNLLLPVDIENDRHTHN